MTTKNYLVFLFIFLTNSLFGQSIVGLYGGINSSKLYFKDGHVDDSNSSNTFLFGIDFKLREVKSVNIGISLSYTTKSFDIKSSSIHSGSGWYRDTHFDLDIVAFDIYPEFSIGKKLIFYANAGPSIGYIIKSKRVGIIHSYVLSSDTSKIQSGSAKEDLNAIDLGIKGACGISYPILNKFCFYLETRYSIGLTSLANEYLTGDHCSFINTKNFIIISGLSYKLACHIHKSLY